MTRRDDISSFEYQIYRLFCMQIRSQSV